MKQIVIKLTSDKFGTVRIYRDDNNEVFYNFADVKVALKRKTSELTIATVSDKGSHLRILTPVGAKRGGTRYIEMVYVDKSILHYLVETTRPMDRERSKEAEQWLLETDIEAPAEEKKKSLAQIVADGNEYINSWINWVKERIETRDLILAHYQSLYEELRSTQAQSQAPAIDMEEYERLKAECKAMRPIYLAYKAGQNLYTTGYVGSIFGLSAQELNSKLREKDILTKDGHLTKNYQQKGYAMLVPIELSNGTLTEQLKWTQDGILFIEQTLGLKRLIFPDDQLRINFNS